MRAARSTLRTSLSAGRTNGDPPDPGLERALPTEGVPVAERLREGLLHCVRAQLATPRHGDQDVAKPSVAFPINGLDRSRAFVHVRSSSGVSRANPLVDALRP